MRIKRENERERAIEYSKEDMKKEREREKEPTEDGSCNTSFRVPLYVRPRIWCDCPPIQ